jgi:hypothetical protein
MKAKTILLTLLLSLSAVSLWAQEGKRVYIKILGGLAKNTVWIYEDGNVNEIEIDNPFWDKKAIQSKQGFIQFGELLEKYFKQGYKLVSSTPEFQYCTYILEKQ